MKRIVLVLFCLTFVFSCKNEETQKEKAKVEKTIEPLVEVESNKKSNHKLTLAIQYKSDVNDIIQCAYNNIRLDENLQKANYLLSDSLKADKVSTNIFKMFGDFVPLVVQLKLGKKPKTILVNNITLKYEDIAINIDGADLNKYFVFNKFIEYDSKTKIIKTKMIDKKHAPNFSLRRSYINKLFGL